jgi:hypothetical protein
MTTGYIWPISAWQEISGDLVAPKDEITVSTLTIRFKFLISYLLFIQIKFSWKIFKIFINCSCSMLLLTFTAGFIIEINRFFLICWDCISRLLFSELILF